MVKPTSSLLRLEYLKGLCFFMTILNSACTGSFFRALAPIKATTSDTKLCFCLFSRYLPILLHLTTFLSLWIAFSATFYE